MSPQEILLQHQDLIKLVEEHQYIPSKDHGSFSQIVEALKIINPKAQYRTDCSGCVMEIVKMAGIHLRAYKAIKSRPGTEFHTFPHHPKKK